MLKNKDLIKILQQKDPEAIVIIQGDKSGFLIDIVSDKVGFQAVVFLRFDSQEDVLNDIFPTDPEQGGGPD